MKFGPHTVTILRAPQVPGDYGTGTQADWPNAVEATVEGCSVQPVSGDEYNVDRDSTLSRWQAWLPPEADVTSTDRITWAGDTYDVDGEVQRWDYPPLSHLVVNLRRSEEAS